MADIIKIDLGGGLFYETPPMPSREEDLLYYDLPKEQQFWRTPFAQKDPLAIYTDFQLKNMTEKERIEHINIWRNRWANGFWWFNNGEPVYFNSLLVDHFAINKYEGRHLNYNRCQRDDMYFRQIVWETDIWNGTMWVKPRRIGMTTEEITEGINILLSDFNNEIGLQSDTLDKAKKTLMSPFIDTYISRPKWMREGYYTSNGKRPRNSLELISVKDAEGVDGLSWLNGRVFVYPTNAKAMDGTAKRKVTMDEASKWPTEANPRQAMEVNLKTLRNAGRRGVLSMLSTSGDSDDVIDSFREWVKLAGESALTNGMTKTISGLAMRFVSAIWSQYLPHQLLPDKYGEVDVARNTEYIVEEIINKKQKGTKEYYYEIRKMPLKIDDALTSASEANYFDKIRMAARKKELDGMLPSEKPYVRGRLEEKLVGSIKKVYFEHDPEGNWLIRWMPYASESKGWDLRNRFRVSSDGVYFPPRNPEGVVGYDPIRYKKELVKTGHVSRAAITVHKKFDYHHKKGDKEFLEDRRIALWVGRPDRPDDAHYEAIKACKFFGYQIAIERQVETAIEAFENENMAPFLMKDPKDNIKGIWTNERVKENGLKLLVSRFAPPRTEDEIDHIEDYPFEDGLIDHMDFDLANSGKFDITMSEIMLEMGLQWLQKTNLQDTENEKFDDFFNRIMPKRRPGAGGFL